MQRFFVDAGQRHVGISDDIRTVSQGIQRLFHGTIRKSQILDVIKVCGGVNDSLENGHLICRTGDIPPAKFCLDDGKALRLNFSGFDKFH